MRKERERRGGKRREGEGMRYIGTGVLITADMKKKLKRTRRRICIFGAVAFLV